MLQRMLVLLAAALPQLAFSQLPTANAYVQQNLVSDIPGFAAVTDPHLVNPWGMSTSASSPFWVTDNTTGLSTLYNGSGAITAVVVTIPAAKTGATAAPTGQVNNSTTGFVLANGKAASFIFAAEDGTISAWNGGTASTIMVNNSVTGAVYTGLAIGTSSTLGPLLYAANLNSGNIDVFNGSFAPAKVAGGFTDAAIPSGFAPYNIWNIAGKLYVTYAMQNTAKNNSVAGVGNGFVSVFDADGNLQKHLISNGPLNAPWGVALAPATFGKFAGDLIVGNFGDGGVNAFDPNTGTALGTLQDTSGKPIQIQGLWALLFGNGKSGGDPNFLYFTAGILNGGAQHGLLGSLAPPATVIGAFNGASNAPGSIAPGEAVVLSGIGIGPSPLASGKIPSTGSLATTLSTTTVTINNTPAPILYASASQTGILVPYEVAGSTTANVVVKSGSQTTASFQVNVASSAPGIFTTTTSGSGQAVAFNQDGSVNSSQNPASAGQVIVIYATGEGATDPGGQDGFVIGDILKTPLLPVSITIGNQPATVAYAGSAPGEISGVLQVEAIVPKGAGTGAVPVVLTVGSASSQTTATISLQ